MTTTYTYVTEYTYDQRNRLTNVLDKTHNSQTQQWTVNKSVECNYDAFDRKVSKSLDTAQG